ncbi:MAG TPA: hypothetical protein VF221_00350, partial [Chloroflexota bacterium]
MGRSTAIVWEVMSMGRGRIGAGFEMEKPDRPIRRGTVRRVVTYFRPYRLEVFLVLVAILVIAVIGLATPLLLKLTIDDAILHRNLGKLTLYTSLMVIL